MIPLEPDRYYHIYNHANGRDELFTEDRHYRFFLRRYIHFIQPVANTFAYCLMPNHFHLLIRIKERKGLQELESFPKFETLEKFISKQFANLFSSYTQAFNRSQNRKGSLFYKNFRRKEITTEEYFAKLVNYIHFNPVVHGFTEYPGDWKYSSYQAILSGKSTMVARSETIAWFGGLDNFMACHRHPFDITI